jgi:midasin
VPLRARPPVPPALTRLPRRLPAGPRPQADPRLLRAWQRLLLAPGTALPAASALRGAPLLRVAHSLMDALDAGALLAASLDAAPATTALLSLVELSDSLGGLLLRLFSHVPSPWQQLAGMGPEQDEAAEELVLAALRALQLEPRFAAAWHMPAALQLVAHRAPAVRWAAAHASAAQLRMGDATLSELVRRRLGEEELAAVTRQWEGRLAAAALERARWWLGEPAAGGEPAAAADGGGASAAAAEGGKTAAKQKRKRKQQQQQQQQQGNGSGACSAGGAPLPASSGFVELCGLEVPCHAAAAAGPLPPSALVRVPAAAAALEAAALALCQRQPVLLEGPPGSGKTAVARELVRATGNAASAFWLHLDDQMDAKSLLGAYTCTPVPGEFAWQPGPLACAVAEGRWVVVEGLDAAPADVVAALAPLLESGTLHVPSRAQVLHAAPGFQIIATITTAPPPAGAGGGADGRGGVAAAAAAAAGGGGGAAAQELLGGLWARVRLEAPSDAEQLQILGGTFPQLQPLLPAALAAAHLAALTAGRAAPSGGAAAPMSPGNASDAGAAAAAAAHAAAAWRGQAAACLRASGLRPGELALQLQRHTSLRDLVKWCRRMAATHGPLLARALRPGDGGAADAPQYVLDASQLDAHVREAAFAEAADLFAGEVSAPGAKLRLLGALAALWALPEGAAQQYEELAKPHVAQSGGEVQVRGRPAGPGAAWQV